MADALTTKTFQFDLVSPERILASERARMVLIPGENGEFGVLAGHAPLLSSLRPGVVTVVLPSNEEQKIFVAGGFADVNGEHCAVLAEEAVNVNDLNRSEIEQQIKALEGDLASAGGDVAKSTALRAQIAIAQAKVQAAA